jgi:hypothetical protein
MGAKNPKILLFIDQCAAHPENTIFLSKTSKLYFSWLTVPASYSLWIWESSMHSSVNTESS